MQLVKNVAKAV